MPSDTVTTFISASAEDRLRMALEPGNGDALRGYLGEAAFDEYHALAERVRPALSPDHLGVGSPKNLVVVPGVMGSLLRSDTLGGVWWLDLRSLGHLNDLRLADDGRSDANANHRILPFAIDMTYEGLLAAVLQRDDFGHVPFAYDWRKPLSASADALRDLINDLYANNGGEKVHLVAHSMGGLMVRAALMAHGAELWPKLGRIVFIATPHYGSPAIASYVKNHLWGFDMMALLGKLIDRQTFRSLWGVLELLPAPRGVYPGTRPSDTGPWLPGAQDDAYPHPTANFDMYTAEDWKLDLTEDDRRRFQMALDGAADFHRRMYHAHMALDQELRNRMAVIAGVGMKTLFRMELQSRLLGLWEKTEEMTTRSPGDPHREGDGRVPLASALLEHVGEIRYVKGEHGGLPMVPQVYEDVFRWLSKEPMKLPRSAAGALGDHLAGEPIQSATPHLDGSVRAHLDVGDPGYWDLTAPDPAKLDVLKAQLDAGRLPEFQTVRLL